MYALITNKTIINTILRNNEQLLNIDNNNEQLLNIDNNNEQLLKIDNNIQPLKTNNNNEQPLKTNNNNEQPLKINNNNVQPLKTNNNNVQPLKTNNNNEQPLKIDNTQLLKTTNNNNDLKRYVTSIELFMNDLILKFKRIIHHHKHVRFVNPSNIDILNNHDFTEFVDITKTVDKYNYNYKRNLCTMKYKSIKTIWNDFIISNDYELLVEIKKRLRQLKLLAHYENLHKKTINRVVNRVTNPNKTY